MAGLLWIYGRVQYALGYVKGACSHGLCVCVRVRVAVWLCVCVCVCGWWLVHQRVVCLL